MAEWFCENWLLGLIATTWVVGISLVALGWWQSGQPMSDFDRRHDAED